MTLSKTYVRVCLLLSIATHCAAEVPVPYGNGIFNTGHGIGASPAYNSGSDSIYVLSGGVSQTDPYGYLFDLDSDLYSTPKFQVVVDPFGADPDSAIVPTPAVGNDGTLYVVSQVGVVYAFKGDGSGNTLWTYDGINLSGLLVHGSPTLGLDGNLYIVTDDTPTQINGGIAQVLYCIDTSLGLPKWELRISQPTGDSVTDIDASPIFTHSGIFAPDEGGFFHLITPLGGEYPPIKIGEPQISLVDSSPAIAGNGLLFVGTGEGNLVAVDPVARQISSTLRLSVDGSSAAVSASPVIGPDGSTLYVGRNDGQFFAVNVSAGSQPSILAEITLVGQPSTATVGSDGRVYLGDDSGTLYSLALQPCTTCGALPEQFVVNWQDTVSSSPFLTGSPLIAQVGVSRADNVVYAASQDGNIYAFYASSGPSAGTWSTFHGNGSRQGSYGRGPVPRPQLISLQFGVTNNMITKSGKAAYGNGSTDYWNPFQLMVKGSFNASLNNLTNSAQQTTQVGISIGGTLHGWNSFPPAFNDPMMQQAGVSYNSAPFTVTISGLSAVGLYPGVPAFYDIYVYGYAGQAVSGNQTYSYNGSFSISPAAQDPVTGDSISTLTTSKSTGWSVTQWEEGNEYVVFRNVPVSTAGQSIVITGSHDPSNPLTYSVINGIQIVARQ